MTDNKKLFFGLKRSKEDPKERKLSMPQCDIIDLPSSFSLKEKVKQIYDQSCLNACSANATASFLSLSDKVDCNISRLFLYFCTRYVDNNHTVTYNRFWGYFTKCIYKYKSISLSLC